MAQHTSSPVLGLALVDGDGLSALLGQNSPLTKPEPRKGWDKERGRRGKTGVKGCKGWPERPGEQRRSLWRKDIKMREKA